MELRAAREKREKPDYWQQKMIDEMAANAGIDKSTDSDVANNAPVLSIDSTDNDKDDSDKLSLLIYFTRHGERVDQAWNYSMFRQVNNIDP